MLTAIECQTKADSIAQMARLSPTIHDDLLVLAAQWCALVGVADWQDALARGLEVEMRSHQPAH